jgi:aromatic ring-cleaving dioxygenase
MDTPADTAAIKDWHAHIYYTPGTRGHAAALREWVEKKFTVRMGRWHEEKVGPHPQAMFQIAFEIDQFAKLVPFLALNRQDLTVLVHPNTKRERDDHTKHAMWFGAVLPMDLSVLREQGE